MIYYIEHDFPIEQLNPLVRREANANWKPPPHKFPILPPSLACAIMSVA